MTAATRHGAGARAAALLATDRALVWHPYGPMPSATAPLLVEAASGVRLTLADGRELIDGMSSWWCAIHGYRHPVLDAAASAQLARAAHVMFGGLTHEPAIELARALVELTPGPLEHVFFADSGSVAVEVAIKMCLQAARGGRTRLLALRGGYHGDTFGAMSVCNPVDGMHHLFAAVLPDHVFAPRPPRRRGPGGGSRGSRTTTRTCRRSARGRRRASAGRRSPSRPGAAPSPTASARRDARRAPDRRRGAPRRRRPLRVGPRRSS